MRQLWIILTTVVLISGTSAERSGKDSVEDRPQILASKLLDLIPRKLCVPSADPDHAQKVFQNFTNYVDTLNITETISEAARAVWDEASAATSRGAEGRAKKVISTTTVGLGLLKFFQEYMNTLVDEFLETVLYTAYLYAPEATDSFLAFLNVTEYATEEEAMMYGMEGRSDNLASDFLSLVADKVSALAPDAAKLQECPPDFDTYRKCFYINSVDYMSHISKRVSAFTANLFGYGKKKL